MKPSSVDHPLYRSTLAKQGRTVRRRIDKSDVQDDEWAIPNVTFWRVPRRGIRRGPGDLIRVHNDGVDRPHRPGRHARHVRSAASPVGDWRWWIMSAVATTVVIAAGGSSSTSPSSTTTAHSVSVSVSTGARVVGLELFRLVHQGTQGRPVGATRPYRLTNRRPPVAFGPRTSALRVCQVLQVVGATHRRDRPGPERTRPGVVLRPQPTNRTSGGTANSISVGRTSRVPPGLPGVRRLVEVQFVRHLFGRFGPAPGPTSASRRSRLKRDHPGVLRRRRRSQRRSGHQNQTSPS